MDITLVIVQTNEENQTNVMHGSQTMIFNVLNQDGKEVKGPLILFEA